MGTIIIEYIVPLGTLLANVFLAGGALFAGWVAWRGWKREIRGQTEYKLAIDLLVGMYRFRDAINFARSPFVSASEMISEEMKHKDMRSEDGQFEGMTNAYQKRWNNVVNAHQELYKDLQIAEAIWGKDIITRFENLLAHRIDLQFAIEESLKSIRPSMSDRKRERYEEKSRKSEHVLYKGADNNPYDKELEKSIKEIEDFLKPKLKS